MKRAFVFMMLSLDGYFEGPRRELDWHNVDTEFNDFAARQLDEADTLIFGRKTYELMAGYWPTAAGRADDPVVAEKMNTMPKVVFSRTLAAADWSHTTLIKDHAAKEFARLKSQPGTNLAILGSSNLCTTLLEQPGLIDELRLMYNPVVLGAGHPVFEGLNPLLKLEPTASQTFASGNVLHRYRPVS